MKKIKTILMLMLLTVALAGIQSCKKDNDDDINNNALSLSFEKTTYSNYEIAQLLAANIPLSQSDYSASIDNDKTVSLIKIDSFLVFAMPELNAGSHTLKVILNGQEYNATFTTVAQPAIADATAYINGIIAEYNTQKANVMAKADSLPANEKTQLLNDLQTIQNYINEANQQLASASDEEKQIAAQILQANKAWMDELKQTIAELSASTAIFRRSGVRNHDAETTAAMEKFVEAKVKLIKHIPKITKYVIGGFVIGGGIGAAIATGIALGELLLDCQELNIAIDDLLTVAFVPFQNMVSSGKTAIQFNNNQFKDLEINIDYRTLYNDDNTSSSSLVNTIVAGLRTVKNLWNGLMDNLPTALSFGPKTVDDKTAFNTQTIRIHSDYLSISDISNSSITSSVNKADGFFNVNFNSNSTTDLNFTFKVNYNNPQLGSLSQTVDAELDPMCLFKIADIVGIWKFQQWYGSEDCSGGTYSSNPLFGLHEFKADGSVWYLGNGDASNYNPLSPQGYDDTNGTSGYGRWSLSCDGILSINFGTIWGGLLNPQGTETPCQDVLNGSGKFVKQ